MEITLMIRDCKMFKKGNIYVLVFTLGVMIIFLLILYSFAINTSNKIEGVSENVFAVKSCSQAVREYNFYLEKGFSSENAELAVAQSAEDFNLQFLKDEKGKYVYVDVLKGDEKNIVSFYVKCYY